MLDLVLYISRQETVANTILKVVAAREADKQGLRHQVMTDDPDLVYNKGS